MSGIVTRALFALCLLPMPAMAETITFQPGAGIFSDVAVNDDRTRATGLWRENGFDVSWLYADDYVSDDFSSPFDAGGAVFFDCFSGGCGGGLLELSVSRPDKRHFALNTVKVEESRSGHQTFVEFFGENTATGEVYEPLFATMTTSWDNILLNGIAHSAFAGPLTNLADAFGNLKLLSLKLTGAPDPSDLSREDNRVQIAEILAEYASTCASSCASLTAADLSFYIERGIFGNFGSRVLISGLDVTLKSAPTHAPVPAALPLAATALAALAFLRQRRRRA